MSKTIPPLTTLPLTHPATRRAEKSFGIGRFQKIAWEPLFPWGVCYSNAEQQAQLQGGERVLGWQILVWPKACVLASHHAVWRTPDGVLIDVTKKIPRDTKTFTTYVEDASISVGPDEVPVIPLKYLPLTDRAEVLQMIAAEQEHSAFKRTLYREVQDAGFRWENRRGFNVVAKQQFHDRFAELDLFELRHWAAVKAAMSA